jgi:hypothetical protein
MMRIPSALELLALWEHGHSLWPVERGLLLLAALFPDQGHDALSSWPLGKRNATLLLLRQALFGTQLDALARCPQCGEQLALSLAVPNLRVPATLIASEQTTVEVQAAGHHWRCRLPTSADLRAVAAISDSATARQTILQRCLLYEQMADEGAQPLPHPIPEPAAGALVERMAEADPQADMQLALTCPSCRARWSVQFDILAYLWTEITDWAQRTLHEVHTLASAYGWTEEVILGLSAQRRQSYLQRVTALS